LSAAGVQWTQEEAAMGGGVIRFGVSMEAELVESFDRLIAERG